MANGPQVEPLIAPEFHPQVPEPLMQLCGKSEHGDILRYLMESNSRQEEATKWLCRQVVAENRSLRIIEARVNESEAEIKEVVTWKDTLTGKTAILGASVFVIASAAVGAALKALVESVLHK